MLPEDNEVIDMNFVVHVSIDPSVIPDYDITHAVYLLREIIGHSEFSGKIVILPLHTIIAC